MSGQTRRAVRLRILGRVQGVWFRGWTVDTASRLGLDGWVRNRRDGSVEAVAAGPGDALDQLIAACKNGPPMARVSGIDVSVTADPGAIGFRQEPTF